MNGEQLGQEFSGVSLSAGTMRPEDVIPKLMFFLEEHDPEAAAKITTEYAGLGWPYSQAGLGFGQDYDDVQQFYAAYLVDDLTDALNEIAPVGHSFGCHPGDPAEMGFWENENGCPW